MTPEQVAGWQLIETAPRDGRQILLYVPPEYVVAQWRVFSDGTSIWVIGHNTTSGLTVALSRSATLWHPIPEGAENA